MACYMASNGRIMLDYELKSKWEQDVLLCFKVLWQNFPLRPRKPRSLQYGIPASDTVIESETPRMQGRDTYPSTSLPPFGICRTNRN
jgi:hypothetical protein